MERFIVYLQVNFGTQKYLTEFYYLFIFNLHQKVQLLLKTYSDRISFRGRIETILSWLQTTQNEIYVNGHTAET